jgi:hypothetical protein
MFLPLLPSPKNFSYFSNLTSHLFETQTDPPEQVSWTLGFIPAITNLIASEKRQRHPQGVAYCFFFFSRRYCTLLPLCATRGNNIKATLRDRQYSLFGPLMTHLGSDKLQATSSWSQALHRMRTGTSRQGHQSILHAVWLYRARRSQTTCHLSAVTSEFPICICVGSFYNT